MNTKKNKSTKVEKIKETWLIVSYDEDADVSSVQFDSAWTKDTDAILRLKRIFDFEEKFAEKNKTKLVPVFVPNKFAEANEIMFVDRKTKKPSFKAWHKIERILLDYQDFLTKS